MTFRAGRARRRLRVLTGTAPSPRRVRAPGRWRPVAGVVGIAVAGTVFGGPVAGVAGAAYALIGVVLLRVRRRDRAESGALDAMLDALAGVAAELRAGADPHATVGPAVAPFTGPGDAGRLARCATAAVRVADSTGAPLADLLDRLDDDARAQLRRRRTAEAQASGASATALLLAGLPLAGIALGYAIGADPGRVLLHTPFGAVCAGGALAGQVVGLAWAHRITRAIGRAA